MISSTERLRADLIRIQDTGPDFVPADYHIEQMRNALDYIDKLEARQQELLGLLEDHSSIDVDEARASIAVARIAFAQGATS